MLTLKVEKRDPKASLSDIRKEGKMPAVFYGKKEESTPIMLSYAVFEKTLKDAGESTIIHLDGEGVDVDVLIHDVDLDPVTDKPRHADFYAIEKGKKIEIDVPLEFVGVAPAVKTLGGVLVKVMHEIKIEALPKDLPQNIEVDISSLNTFEDVITAKDLKLPNGVEIKENGEEVVASVYEPKEEVVESPTVDLSAIEVEKKGKEAKEGVGEEESSKTDKK
ncbi:MAG: 50S ribosomal protein L25 [Candidatus Paceibacterota bacterium]